MKKILFLSIFLLLQLSSFAQQDSVLAQQYYKEAIETEDWDTKLELLQKSLDAGYDALFIYEQMGYVYEFTNKLDLDLAIEYYKKSLEFVETDYQASIMNSSIAGPYITKEDYASAEIYCKKALDTDRPYAGAYIHMGDILYYKEDYRTAISYYSKGTWHDPYSAYYSLVLCYENLEEYISSLYYAEKLLLEAPDLDYAKKAKIRGLYHTNKIEEALAALKNWYPTDTEFESYEEYRDLGILYFNVECFKYAQKLYTKASELLEKVSPRTGAQDTALYYLKRNVGLSYSCNGKHEKAREVYEKLKATHSKDYYLWYIWAYDYMVAADYKNAIKLFKKSLKIKPDYVGSITDCALCYSRLGDSKKAVELYTEAIDHYSEDAALFNDRAWEYIQMKELDRAYHDIHRAMDLEPESVVSMITLGDYYFAKEEFDEAIETMNEALKAPGHTSATDQYAYYTRGKAYASRHNGGLAIADFEAVLEIDPNFAPALQELGIAIKRKGNYCDAKPHLERAILKKDKFKDYDFTRAQKTLDQIKDKNCRD
ncbi:MAG: tetratricopeptide repeat protein [Aureispira sp.]|nr:tetratricopeptide repeat protein [Aureispira sp.]